MKPEPVRPIHGSVPGTQKNSRIPLVSKKVGPGPQPLALRCHQESRGQRLPAAKFTFSGQNKVLESALQVEIQSHFLQRSKSVAAETAPKRDHESPHPQQRAQPTVDALPTLGNPSSPTVSALISNQVHPGDGWNFP